MAYTGERRRQYYAANKDRWNEARRVRERKNPWQRPRIVVAAGCDRKSGKTVSIVFPVDTFAEIRALAKRGSVTFSEQVRTLCEWGLEDLTAAGISRTV